MSSTTKQSEMPTRLTIPPPPEAVHDIVVNDAMKDDIYWMPLNDRVWFRPLMFNTVAGSWINLIKAEGAGTISRHRHPAPVTAFTLEGAWYYPEHDWVAPAGTFVFEPPGDTHTLMVHPSAGRMMGVFHNFGAILYVDENGRQVDYDDVFTRLEKYKKYARQAGIPMEYIENLTR